MIDYKGIKTAMVVRAVQQACMVRNKPATAEQLNGLHGKLYNLTTAEFDNYVKRISWDKYVFPELKKCVLEVQDQIRDFERLVLK